MKRMTRKMNWRTQKRREKPRPELHGRFRHQKILHLPARRRGFRWNREGLRRSLTFELLVVVSVAAAGTGRFLLVHFRYGFEVLLFFFFFFSVYCCEKVKGGFGGVKMMIGEKSFNEKDECRKSLPLITHLLFLILILFPVVDFQFY